MCSCISASSAVQVSSPLPMLQPTSFEGENLAGNDPNASEQGDKMHGRFFWQCRGQSFQYERHRRYLVYFAGCFSPAHRGHFSQIQEALQHRNVRVMVHQVGDVKRHGVPYALNALIMRTYVRELVGGGRVTVKRRRSWRQLLDHVRRTNCDTVVVIRGAEHEKLDLAKAEASTLRRFAPVLSALAHQGRQCAFVYSERPQVKTLSATRFTEALKSSRAQQRDWRARYRLLKPFFPVGLHHRVAQRLVKRLDRCRLRTNSVRAAKMLAVAAVPLAGEENQEIEQGT